MEKGKSFPISDEERLKMVGDEANLLLLQRKYQQLLQLGQRFPDDAFAAVPGSLAMKYFAIGIAQKGLGDDAAARTAFLKAKNILEEQLKQKPEDADLHVQLAKVLAWLGEKDAAIAEAQRAMDLRPESKDAFEGPQITEQVAQVYAILGDNARAIELLDGLLSRPSEVTLQTLKLNPAWDRFGTIRVPGVVRQIRRKSLGPILGVSPCEFATLLTARPVCRSLLHLLSCWSRLLRRRRQSGKFSQPNRNLAAEDPASACDCGRRRCRSARRRSMLQFSPLNRLLCVSSIILMAKAWAR